MEKNRSTLRISYKNQQGFTLIELMISFVLGLLISAAIIQVFLTSQRVDRIQTAGSEIQDKAIFGLQSIEPQLRLANLGNDGMAINDTTAMGGVILTVGNKDATNVNIAVKDGNQAQAGDYVTRSVILTNTNIPSDQLTIQYTNTTGRELFDCEGKDIEPNAHVITRYFITDGKGAGRNARKNLDLNCEAGRIASDGTLTDFSGAGVTIIEKIDQFNIRLGVQRTSVVGGDLTYQYADMTVKDYMALAGEKPNITNIRLAILARSTANSPDASAETFTIFGDLQTLKSQTNAPKYLRRVYESNVLLRNARVMRVIDSGTQ